MLLERTNYRLIANAGAPLQVEVSEAAAEGYRLFLSSNLAFGVRLPVAGR